jgi:serine/threonine protein kinase
MPSSSEATQAPTVDGFLRAILRSGLLNRAQLKAALKGVPRERRDDPQALADHLIRTGKLSRFQANKLLKGMGVGLILGPFQLLTPIGQGGMGTVFLARDARGNQLVALKVLPPRRARIEERTLARFRREMEMSQKVIHQHLAWTYEVGSVRGVHYIAMEYIPGRTLSRLVVEEGPLPLARATRLMVEVAWGLAHAHQQGLIHRDIKPSNIQVTPNHHAKVLDLGLALFQDEVVEDHTIVGGRGYIVGTMDYISPEQSTDPTGVDVRADLYSLGCTLYFALTGQPPFPGGTSKQKIQRHRTEGPAPIETLRPDLPADFVRLLNSLMSKDPAQRPPSARAAAEALSVWASEAPPESPEALTEQVVEEAEKSQELGSSDFSAISLPELEITHLLSRPAFPVWLVLVLVLGVVFLGGVGALAGLLSYLAWH